LKKIILVIDIEATCWNDYKHKRFNQEIIEIGAVILEEINGEFIQTGHFDEIVKPIIHPKLSAFCKKLTPITQKEIDESNFFPQVITNLRNKVKKITNGKSCKKVIFASWGGFDKKQLLKDCKLHKIHYPFGTHWDVEKSFSRFTNNNKRYSVEKALKYLDQHFIGKKHRGGDDAINTSIIIQKSFGINWKKYSYKKEKSKI
jgi:inhibitor of KinA sporulation pathway (predicted exonuclease)